MPPFDFASIMQAGQNLVPDFMEGDIQRARLAQANAQTAAMQSETMARDREADEDSRYQADLDFVLANPHDPSAIRNLLIKYPKKATALKAGMDSLDATTRKRELTAAAEVYYAASGGKWELAASQLEKRITADKAAGKADTSVDEALLEAIRSNDPDERNFALNMMAMHVGAATGEDHFGTVVGQLDKARRPDLQSVAPGATLINPGEIDPVTGQPRVVYESPYKEQVVMVDGRPFAYTPGQGGGAPTASPNPSGSPSGAPRGIRNNNPGNLRFGPFARSMGATGQDSDGFAIFGDPSTGTRAQEALLSGKAYLGGGRNTIASIISKYAPSSDGNDVGNYARFVAKQTGIAPNQPIGQAQIPAIAAAMRAFENGTGSSSNASGRPAGKSDAQLRSDAQAAIKAGANPKAVGAQLRAWGVR